jgi:hypothetical protein
MNNQKKPVFSAQACLFLFSNAKQTTTRLKSLENSLQNRFVVVRSRTIPCLFPKAVAGYSCRMKHLKNEPVCCSKNISQLRLLAPMKLQDKHLLLNPIEQAHLPVPSRLSVILSGSLRDAGN